MNYRDLFILTIPEIMLTAGALIVLAVDLNLRRTRTIRARMLTGAVLTTLTCLAAGGWVIAAKAFGNFYEGMLVLDALTRLIKPLLLLMTIFTALISVDTHFTDHVGEFFALLLLATIGMMFLVSTENVLMIFISLELLSLSLYILTAFNKQNLQSAEAALKYFLIGGMSAAFMLFGLSLIYGLSGELELRKIAQKVSMDPLLLTALIMVVIGFGFKVAAVPFHLWAPDAYQGAPAASAAFIASGSKLASFFVLARVMMVGFKGAEGSAGWNQLSPGWLGLIAVLAALSVLVGNLAAIAQSSVRRLLAYSAVAQAGYMLTGLLANNDNGLASLLYYAVTYALTALGAFAVVAIVQERAGGEQLGAFAGLAKRAPGLSFCMLIFLLSLAGIPPLAGFFGKFYLFSAATSAGVLWLVIFAIAMSAVSLYYYLQVLKQIYVVNAEGPRFISCALGCSVAALLAGAVIVLGCAPDLLVKPLLRAIQTAGM
jgi:NADH-quinone oxidoreductase subunit N